MSLATVVTILLLITASPAFAQVPRTCPPPSPYAGRPYFDFQVDQPAAYAGRDSALIKPNGPRRSQPFPPDFALAQFVVDSLGVPVPASLKLLVHPAELTTDAVSLALVEWRYHPARVAGCRVSQLVQASLRWKQ
jgi:hypothetical protein